MIYHSALMYYFGVYIYLHQNKIFLMYISYYFFIKTRTKLVFSPPYTCRNHSLQILNENTIVDTSKMSLTISLFLLWEGCFRHSSGSVKHTKKNFSGSGAGIIKLKYLNWGDFHLGDHSQTYHNTWHWRKPIPISITVGPKKDEQCGYQLFTGQFGNIK